MAEAPVLVIRNRRWASVLLTMLGPRRVRLAIALLLSVAGGAYFASYTVKYIKRPLHPDILEYGIGTLFLNRYLGLPLEGPDDMEANPTDAATQPKFDRFCRNLATRIKTMVGDPRTRYSADVRGIGACEWAKGWPFVSRDISYRVYVDEWERFDGKRPGGHRFRAGQDGLAPEQWLGWAGNVACGFVALSIGLFSLMTLAAAQFRIMQRPVAGFPVIVPTSPSGRADVIAEYVIPQD